MRNYFAWQVAAEFTFISWAHLCSRFPFTLRNLPLPFQPPSAHGCKYNEGARSVISRRYVWTRLTYNVSVIIEIVRKYYSMRLIILTLRLSYVDKLRFPGKLLSKYIQRACGALTVISGQRVLNFSDITKEAVRLNISLEPATVTLFCDGTTPFNLIYRTLDHFPRDEKSRYRKEGKERNWE